MSDAATPTPEPSKSDGDAGEATASARGNWGSRLGFILAAAGSAVGLGNIWKFPYITGENGGGLFVLIYLACIAVVGLPIMIAEVMIGRAAQRAPVGAFEKVHRAGSPWKLAGWAFVLTGFIILSYYSVVAGWAMHYVWLAISGGLDGIGIDQAGELFGKGVFSNTAVNLFWHVIFMAITVGVVLGGVSRGIETVAKILMPVLLLIMLGLMADAMLQKGFGPACEFLFSPNAEKLSPAGVLEALGHAFFTLSLGMGAMLTYGSYLKKDTDLIKSSVAVSVLDTGVAILACLVMYPILFTFAMEPAAGPGLVFISIPVALEQMTGGQFLAIAFFLLLTFAALTSAISLLEVVTSTVIDQLGWSRGLATTVMGGAILLFGIPSALSGSTELFGDGFKDVFGKNWFDTFDFIASNWALPLGGFVIAVFVGWVMPDEARRKEFCQGTTLSAHYPIWLFFLRYVAPVAILVLFLYSAKIISFDDPQGPHGELEAAPVTTEVLPEGGAGSGSGSAPGEVAGEGEGEGEGS